MRFVPHIRPELGDTVRATLPVGGYDWSGLGALANFSNGHGGMLIPWCAIGQVISSGATNDYHFYIAPKLRAVERVWVMNVRSASMVGTTVSIAVDGTAVGGARPLSSFRDSRSTPIVFRQSLTAKTSTAADTYVSITATGGNVTVESLCMYEQTRGVLDASNSDYGVDVATLSVRQPLADFNYQSAAGVCDAYKNLDARRAGLFHWSTAAASAIPITATVGSGGVALFPFGATMATAIPTVGESTSTVTCAVYAKTAAASTGSVKFTATVGTGTVTLAVTSTTYAWVTGALTDVQTEDMTTVDGRRGAAWEQITMLGWTSPDAAQMDVQAISIVRVTAPI